MKAVDVRELSQIPRCRKRAIAYPTDIRLLEVARKKLAMLARCHGITLRQSYARQGPGLSHKAGQYAHSRRFKRMQRVLRQHRPVLGRLLRYAAQAGPPQDAAAVVA
jgi:transposase, IS5 family